MLHSSSSTHKDSPRRFQQPRRGGGGGAKMNKHGRVEHSYTVTYNSQSHWSVITQRWGSDWKILLPYCLFNTMLMALLHVLLLYGIDLEISDTGHNFLSLVVAFLLVQRVLTSLGRYNEARDYLQRMNQNCRQFIHAMVVSSNSDARPSGKEWRHEVAYGMLMLLRTATAVIDYPSTGVRAVELVELMGGDLVHDLTTNFPPTRWLHDQRSDFEENLRIPVRLSYILRKAIRSQQGRLRPTIQEGDLYPYLDSFMDGYYGIHKLLTTPVPFPLIQMTSTLLFFYLFTVPFALLSADDKGAIAGASHCLIVFVLTYGFMGMEFVSIQLDDPFGDDANDFNNLALAQTAFEDAYVTIQDVDGSEWADKLRFKMHDHSDEPIPSERSWLLDGQGATSWRDRIPV